MDEQKGRVYETKEAVADSNRCIDRDAVVEFYLPIVCRREVR